MNYATGQLEEKGFKKISVELNGRDISDITSMIQDEKGYVWLGTDLGLLRYNGYEFQRYNNNTKDTTSLHDNDVKALCQDDKGDIWIGTASGLSRYNPSCDCFFRYPSTPDNPTPTGFISDIIEDQNKRIWFSMRNGGLFRYERESDGFIQVLHQPNDAVSLHDDLLSILLADSDNNIWIGTGFGHHGTGLLRFNPKTGKAKRFVHSPDDKNSLIDNRISSLYEDQAGQLFVGTYKSGLHIFEKKEEKFNRIEFDPNQPDKLHAPYIGKKVPGFGLNAVDPFVRIIHQDNKGGFWIGTSGAGVNYFDPETKEKSFYAHDKAKFGGITSNNNFRSFFEDNQGGIWLALEGGILYRKDIYDRKFTYYPETYASERVYESPLNPGTIWSGSEGGGLRKIDIKTGKVTTYLHDPNNDNSIGHNSVRNAYQEDENTLWVGVGSIGGDTGGEDGLGGLDKMDINKGTFEHFKFQNKDSLNDFSYTIYDVCEDSKGHLWIIAGYGGIFRSNKTKTAFEPFIFPNPDSVSIKPVIYELRKDSKGMIWVSDSELIGSGTTYRYDPKQHRFFPFVKGFESTSIKEDKDGWYWMSTWQDGVLHYNPADHTYKQFTTEDGLGSVMSTFLVGGEEGIYWIGTRFGISRLDAKTEQITPVNLPSDRFYYGATKTSDGQLFFITYDKGLVSFFPDQIKGNPLPPNTIISNFLISDEPYNWDENSSDELSLSHIQNDISIEYVGLHFTNPSKNRHQYKLTPVDDNWINAGTNRIARYPNLNPGMYTFEVKAANSDGVWNEKSTMITFEIKPAWWKTWWAYLFYAFLIGFTIYGFYQFQLSRQLAVAESERLKEVNQLKSTLYTNITHEFRTPLTVIQGMTDNLRSNLETKQFEEAETSLDMIQRNGQRLLRLVNEMLDLAKLESGNMELNLIQSDIITYLKYLCESFHALAKEKEIKLTVYSELDKYNMDFDAAKIASIISNLLSNAIKFTSKEGTIIVHLSTQRKTGKEYFSIKVKDDGLGIAKKDLENIFSRFYQVDSSTSREQEGTGIGLTLTKELIELMGGNITLKSELQKGSTFTVQIPVTNAALITTEVEVAQENLVVAPIVTSKPKEAISSNENLPSLLIIEDNPDVAHYLETCLKGRYKTQHAINGAIGIEMALEMIPDIIISDVMMPEKDGFEVCATLKTHKLTDHVPIILLTAKATVQDRLAGLSHGADAYLAKPFVKAELFTRLDQLVLLRKKMLSKFEQNGYAPLLTKRVEDPETKFLQKAVKIIHNNISDYDLNAARLASKLHLSESQVYRKLKAITDKSTAVFIRSVRLQKAKELIQTTDKPISEIAYDVGFNDPSWFSRAFKEEFSFSPKAMRK